VANLWKFGGSAVLLAALVGCGEKRARTPRITDASRLPHVEIVDPRREPLMVINIDVTAQVEAMERSDLCARVPGEVETLQPDPARKEVDIGSVIREGEPLLRLKVPELVKEKEYKEALAEQARHQVALAKEAQKVSDKELVESRELERRYQAEYTMRKAKHDRTMKLVQSGSLQPEVAEETLSQFEAGEGAWRAAKASIETRQAKLAAAAADLKVAESRVKVAEHEAQRLGVLVDYATVRAPFDGIVVRRLVDRGAMVKDTTPVLTVARTDKVRVLLDIPERYVPLVNSTELYPNADGQGDMVDLHIAALTERVPASELRGPITRLASALDPATRTMRAEVHLDNKAGHIRPGMYGTATVNLERLYKVLTIPSTALVRRDGELCVFCVELEPGEQSRGRARVKRIKLGIDDGKRIQVKEGLNGDELIIAKGNGVIHEGDEVIAVRADE
jgi:RND family efflux transporter MFP subunit